MAQRNTGDVLDRNGILSAEAIDDASRFHNGTRITATLFRLSEGGFAVSRIYRLPAGCSYRDAPVYFADEAAARQALTA